MSTAVADPSVAWVDAAGAAQAQTVREELLAAAGDGLRWAANGTKPYCGDLAPGCRICAAGGWSCLFVNGICNGRCFFCPTPQDAADDVPATSGIEWPRPAQYADYVEAVGIAGVSISGGEPLLTLDRSVAYIRTLRDRRPDLHIWLYSNGLLATPERCERLVAAGLNEMRFNLCASRYRLDGVRAASGIVPTLTVEIPAVPEDEAELVVLLPTLAALGVRHLNLHQLRLTPHNRARLEPRGYHYVPTPEPVAVESEHTALRVLLAVLEQGLPLGVNLCTYRYKNSAMAVGGRRRAARLVCQAGDVVTATGHIRRVRGQTVSYLNPVIVEAVSYRHPFREIELPHGRSIFVESRPVLRNHPLTTAGAAALAAGEPPADLALWERPVGGLAPYAVP